MSGTYEPESPTDQQCRHCGLYFRAQGIHNHESSCYLDGHDAMIQPVDESRGEVEDPERVGRTESPTLDEPDETPTPDPEQAVTDGGNPALDAPEPVATDGGQDESACPDCGSRDYFDADDVRRARDCGGSAAELLDEHDRVCADCGEVYDA
ncbi:hypothetical protein SAMN04487947_0571 [Halogeometricum rufum]|uniref:Uncharacterized protein n=1 Tax=Halogeometricum rufum TaxID=553469 RepID=A0A1I6G4Q9_9EURY|nr:hypothetical protein [Halogeometricum rufum]SFR37179.1 hypothetical protein SAMN04487947_0571 [Halogeometricum rufum]